MLPRGQLTVIDIQGSASQRNPKVGDVVELDRDPFRIGCYLANEMVFIAQGISRFHTVVVVEDGAWCVTDPDETAYGTWLRGTRVKRHKLVDGDRIMVGPLGDPKPDHPRVGLLVEFSTSRK